MTSYPRVILASIFTKFQWLQFPAFMSRNVSEISRRSNSCLQTSLCSIPMNNTLDKIYSKIKYICCKTLLMTINICFKSVILYENTLNLAKNNSEVFIRGKLSLEWPLPGKWDNWPQEKAKIPELVYNDMQVWTIAAP